MRTSRVLTKLHQDIPSWGLAMHATDPTFHEMAGFMGPDVFWLDLEHHHYSLETASHMIRGARVSDTDVVARPAKGEFMRMSRLLETGATGIMYPRCDDAKEASEVVKWAKFAPLGKRGADTGNADTSHMIPPLDRYTREANEQTFIVIQLEDQNAINEAEAIAAVPGVDFVMLGPGDFSILSGFPGRFDHPKLQKAMKSVAAAARNTGKNWAAIGKSGERARELIQEGCRLLWHMSDLSLLQKGIRESRRAMIDAGIPLRGISYDCGKTYVEDE